MGFWQDITGQTAADASRAAAADTYAKQTAAARGIQDYGDTYPQHFQPWIGTGQNANTAVNQLISNPSSVQGLPGYQFGMDQGTKAVNSGAAARGILAMADFRRLNGADMSRREELKKGRIPLQTFRADIDFHREKAHIAQGDIGITVWIYRGEVFEAKGR